MNHRGNSHIKTLFNPPKIAQNDPNKWSINLISHLDARSCIQTNDEDRHRRMERFVLGTSRPSFKPESKARPNLLVLFPTVCLGIPLKIIIFLPLDHKKMTFAMLFCQKSIKIIKNPHFYLSFMPIFSLHLRPNNFLDQI